MAEKVTIARPYAQAIVEIAKEQGRLAEWSEMLGFCAAVAANEELAEMIASPMLSSEQVTDLFLKVCGDQLDETGEKMIRVLAEGDRLSFLPEIADLYEQARAEAEGSVRAEVISATELSEGQQSAIVQAMQQRLGRNITLECTIDKSLLGGAIIRAGDEVIDGSVVGKLHRLATVMAH